MGNSAVVIGVSIAPLPVVDVSIVKDNTFDCTPIVIPTRIADVASATATKAMSVDAYSNRESPVVVDKSMVAGVEDGLRANSNTRAGSASVM